MRRLIDFTTFYTNRTVFDKPYKILWISLQLVSYRTICEATATCSLLVNPMNVLAKVEG